MKSSVSFDDFFFKNLQYNGLTNAYKELGISYLGNVGHSVKLLHSQERMNVATYGIYLASSNLSGFQACGNDKNCKTHCLMGSGQGLMDFLSGKNKLINSRIKKTRLKFLNKEFFNRMVFAEIEKYKVLSKLDNELFAVRLNCTSDLNPLNIEVDGVNVLEKFNSEIFYDYTKVPNRLGLVKKYKNYHLTFSFDGENYNYCEQALEQGINVAIVFEKLPKRFNGIEVINGDFSDYRPNDKKGEDGNGLIVGLLFKRTHTSIKNHKYSLPDTPFIIKKDDPRCEY